MKRKTEMTTLKTKIGRIYKKRNKRPDGTFVDHQTWTVRFKGVEYATKESNPEKAKQFVLALAAGLKPAQGNLAKYPTAAVARAGTAAATGPAPILMETLFKQLASNALRKGNRDARGNTGQVAKHLTPFFGKTPAADLTTEMIENYTDMRLGEDAANGTINKELASLKRALNIAVKRDPPQILRRPQIDMLPAGAPRKGFVSQAQYEAVKALLPDYVVPILVAGYHVGSRKGELLQVELDDIEMDSTPPQFRLYPDATKSGKGRVIPIFGEMVPVFRAQIANRKPGNTLLFHNNGEPIQSFYKVWRTAIKAAGVPNFLFHDLRRTAVRNLIRSGVSRKVAMAITGHLTESVFDRYDITDETDLHDAAMKVGAYIDGMKPTGTQTTPAMVS